MPELAKVERSVPVFIKILMHPMVSEMDIIIDCCWALSYLSDGSKLTHKKIIEGGGTERLISFLKSSTLNLVVPTIRIVGNLCGCKDYN
jgi:hypothetical protein